MIIYEGITYEELAMQCELKLPIYTEYDKTIRCDFCCMERFSAVTSSDNTVVNLCMPHTSNYEQAVKYIKENNNKVLK